MLTPPNIPEEKLIAHLRDYYGIIATQITFLPLGADRNSVHYRVFTKDRPYFLKLRLENFEQTAALVPQFLHDQGINQIIPPILTKEHQPWISTGHYHIMLYPFIEGHSSYGAHLTDQSWKTIGAVLKKIHTLSLPNTLTSKLRKETFSSEWYTTIQNVLHRANEEKFQDATATKLAQFLQTKQEEIANLAEKTNQLSQSVQLMKPPFVLCHCDLRTGNILIDTHNNEYIIDWDNPMLAPKERDLMYIGGNRAVYGDEETEMFYKGYRDTAIQYPILAYYRFRYVLEDIGEFCKEIWSTNQSSEDKERGLGFLMKHFEPNGTVETTKRTNLLF